MMKCRNATLIDCESIVEIHQKSFEIFFLTTLGKSFLGAFYKACIKSLSAVTVVSCNDAGRVIGFATGSINADGFYRGLLIKNIIPFSVQAAKLVFTKPGALIRLAKNITKQGSNEISDGAAELLSIASLPEVRGQGVGKLLLETFEIRLRERGCSVVSLTTDFYNNDEVVGFYLKSGYVITDDFITYPERRMYKMTKKISKQLI